MIVQEIVCLIRKSADVTLLLADDRLFFYKVEPCESDKVMKAIMEKPWVTALVLTSLL